MDLFGQKRLYSGTSCCIRAYWLYSGEVVLIGQGVLFVVLFGQSGCFRIKCLYSGKNGYIRAKVVLLPKVVVFGQSGCIRVN